MLELWLGLARAVWGLLIVELLGLLFGELWGLAIGESCGLWGPAGNYNGNMWSL